MKYINKRLLVTLPFILLLGFAISSMNACQNSNKIEPIEVRPIKNAEIITFQKAYGVSYNAISAAIENDSYYETAALKHIEKCYNFDEGKVMFKIGNDESEPFRNTHEGLLSYLIGKNKEFPNDEGIANRDWRKMEWKNNGIINEGNMAIIIGVVKMKNDKGEQLSQNFTMCIKRNKAGELKLIAHKISTDC